MAKKVNVSINPHVMKHAVKCVPYYYLNITKSDKFILYQAISRCFRTIKLSSILRSSSKADIWPRTLTTAPQAASESM